MESFKIQEDFAHYAASKAQRAILYEVSTTPKPGLVDRDNNGSHKDMDFFTFMASSSALYKGLYECTLEGLNFEDTDSTRLLDKIRAIGFQCEKEMFKATNGINAHKGTIFSIGILCAVTGKMYKEFKTTRFTIEEICTEVRKVAKGLVAKDFKGISDKRTLTHGEGLFKEYGIKGIRGEVESGFETLQKSAVQILRNWRNNKRLSINDLFLDVLLNLMAEAEDTNVIIRGGRSGLDYVKAASKNFLKQGGMYSPLAKEKLQEMNEDFIKKNLSPGGCADLLSAVIFLGMMEGIIE